MPQIEFIAEHRHADDGVTIKTYNAGTTVNVSQACADAALRLKVGRMPGNSQAGGALGVAPASSSSDPDPVLAPKPSPGPSSKSAAPPSRQKAKGRGKPSKSSA
ncbi:hypothetical protein [Maricaulis sp.]|uniref:hypothetical protein n=1 Tax=Maricaulis sp. TaxID=1486257 RepID=UPI000C4A61F4|nr:hypothetical protein [Maricaulis sp.]MAC89662.1 hypothetical protein [Maricaulis sp.]